MTPDPIDRCVTEYGRSLESAATTPARRHRRSKRASLAVAFGVLVVAGSATAAAVTLLQTGEPVPDAPAQTRTQLNDKSIRVLPIETQDPVDGNMWGLATTQPEGRPTVCLSVGRVQEGVLGVIGTAGAFGDDGAIHPLSPASARTGLCGGAATAPKVALSDRRIVASSGWTAPTASPDSGCRIEGESRGAGRTCEPDELRVVTYGLAGSDAVSVELAAPGSDPVRVAPEAGTNGAYLFVQSAGDGSSGAVRVRYSDGSSCAVAKNDAGPDSCARLTLAPRPGSAE